MTDSLGRWVTTVDASADFNGALAVATTQFGLAASVGTLAGGTIGGTIGGVALGASVGIASAAQMYNTLRSAGDI
ncbi:hypothetical protein [Nocardia sp. NPDC059228]|uniref:hypothetical protein n=1 Tax=Nocardia sp. NPDC059228 TaxID=3346777 RepID=UPI0036A6FE7A